MPKQWSTCAWVVTTDHGVGVMLRTAAASSRPSTAAHRVSITTGVADDEPYVQVERRVPADEHAVADFAPTLGHRLNVAG